MPSGPFRVGGEVLATHDERDARVRYWLRAGTRDVPLDEREIVIGRGDECEIDIHERGVSGRHARIRVEKGLVLVEDLGSATGTFVNGTRAYGPVALKPGDCITIGTRVLEIYEYEPGPPSEVRDRPTPISGIAALSKGSLAAPETNIHGPDTHRRPRRPTVRFEEFESAGRLAERMLAAGRAVTAEQILAERILDVLEAARAGELPTIEMIDAIGRYGIKLANATLDTRWADAVIELHTLAARPLRLEPLRRLAVLRSRTRLGDDERISQYCAVLRSRYGAMSPVEQSLSLLVADLMRAPNRDR